MGYRYLKGDKLKHFSVQRALGQSQNFEVYLAKDTVQARDVALKVLCQESGKDKQNSINPESWLTQSKELSQLIGESIPRIDYVSSLDESPLFVAAEFVKGDTLEAYCQSHKVDIRFALSCLIEVSRGLNQAHEKGIYHGHLNPSNLFYTTQKRFKVLDFAEGKAVDSKKQAKESDEKRWLSSLLFQAPECFVGVSNDPRLDIYSLGMIVIQILQGRTLVEYESGPQMYEAIENQVIRLSKDVENNLPPDLLDLIYQMIEKDPSLRPQSMGEVLERSWEVLDNIDANTNVVFLSDYRTEKKNQMSKSPWFVFTILLFLGAFGLINQLIKPSDVQRSIASFQKKPQRQSPNPLLNKTYEQIGLVPEGEQKQELLKLFLELEGALNRQTQKSSESFFESQPGVESEIDEIESLLADGKYLRAKSRLRSIKQTLETPLSQ